MNIRIKISIFALLVLSFINCSPDNAESKNVNNSDTLHFSNITILIDLSDRIAKSEKQIFRDTTIIFSILESFNKQVKKNGYLYSKDRIQVLIAPQPGNEPMPFNPSINVEDIANSSKVVREILPQYVNSFKDKVRTIYSNNDIEFNGADIWSFFKDAPETYKIKSYTESYDNQSVYNQFDNKILIFTDGYIYFDSKIQNERKKDNSCMEMNALRKNNNWEQLFEKYKLQKIEGKNLHDIDVMLVELDPKDKHLNTEEIDILKKYWTTWFTDMGVRNRDIYFLEHEQPLSTIQMTIDDFLTRK